MLRSKVPTENGAVSLVTLRMSPMMIQLTYLETLMVNQQNT